MKILILGDPNKFFRIEYVKNMKRFYKNYQFHIASNVPIDNIDHEYDKVIHLEYKSSRNKIKQYINLFKQINNLEEYDYIHIHSANIFWLPLILHFKRKAKKIILTYYGSDFYRSKKINKILLFLYNQIVDKITFTSERMQKDVSKFIFNRSKTVVIPFGIRVLEDIEHCLSHGKNQLKKEMGINPESIVISVGYNATKQQHHNEILNAIETASNVHNDITVLLPLNYGNVNYCKELMKSLGKYKLKIITSSEFLSGYEIAKLRSVSDIMVHMQDSDQFSASIIEYLYADNILINCSWIDYKELKHWGIYYKEVSSYEELGKVLYNVLDQINEERLKLNSKELIKRNLGWEIVSKKWDSLYQ